MMVTPQVTGVLEKKSFIVLLLLLFTCNLLSDCLFLLTYLCFGNSIECFGMFVVLLVSRVSLLYIQKQTHIYIHIIYTWNPNDLYFWRSTRQNKAFSNQNKGHLGSRYTYTHHVVGWFFGNPTLPSLPDLTNRRHLLRAATGASVTQERLELLTLPTLGDDTPWCFRNPGKTHQLIYVDMVYNPTVNQGFVHPRWLFGISSINSIASPLERFFLRKCLTQNPRWTEEIAPISKYLTKKKKFFLVGFVCFPFLNLSKRSFFCFII